MLKINVKWIIVLWACVSIAYSEVRSHCPSVQDIQFQPATSPEYTSLFSITNYENVPIKWGGWLQGNQKVALRFDYVELIGGMNKGLAFIQCIYRGPQYEYSQLMPLYGEYGSSGFVSQQSAVCRSQDPQNCSFYVIKKG